MKAGAAEALARVAYGLRVLALHTISRRRRPSRKRAAAHRRRGDVVKVSIAAEPQPINVELDRTALIIIDMQRDFLEPGGFGETLGNDVSRLQAAVKPLQAVLAAARDAGLLVIHTREGHRPDLSDAPPAKVERGAPSMRIGDAGPMGRILIRGEPGHDIVPELYPIDGRAGDRQARQGRVLPDRSRLDAAQLRASRTSLVSGVTTEVCVNTTVREANDRGYRCIVLGDCCASYFPEFHEMGLKMIKAQGGIFGWVSDSKNALAALSRARARGLRNATLDRGRCA